jgi:hypothetical protein
MLFLLFALWTDCKEPKDTNDNGIKKLSNGKLLLFGRSSASMTLAGFAYNGIAYVNEDGSVELVPSQLSVGV